MTFRRIQLCGVAVLALAGAACDLDLADPNTPTEEEVLADQSSMLRVAIGLQAEYSNLFADPVTTTAMVTNELGANTATFESYRVVDTGSGPATNDFGFSTGPWSGQYRVVRIADFVIDNAPNAGFGPGMTSGLLAMGKLYKAMALGNLIQIYERIPIAVGEDVQDAPFATRQEALTYIVSLLEEAQAHVTNTPPATEFTTQVLAPGFDLVNTIRAMLARYALIAGDLAKADAAAALVSPTVFSEFRFSATDANPIWNLAVNGGNSTSMRPEDSWRTAAEAGDQRLAYWTTVAAINGFAGTNVLDNFNRYSDRTHSYPAYLPDEMKLIRAEVAARQNRLTDALVFVNQVRTQCTSTLPEPLACLPALTIDQVSTQQLMLAEILKQRRYELYLQHLRWSDLRRFGQPVKYMWMPVPITECDRNSSTPFELCQAVAPTPNAAS